MKKLNQEIAELIAFGEYQSLLLLINNNKDYLIQYGMLEIIEL